MSDFGLLPIEAIRNAVEAYGLDPRDFDDWVYYYTVKDQNESHSEGYKEGYEEGYDEAKEEYDV
jgi:hypothetical protein